MALSRLPLLNTNTTLSAVQTQNEFVAKFKVYPFEMDEYEVLHRARFVEVRAKKIFIGGLGYDAYHGVLDLSTGKFHGQKAVVVAPEERFKKSVLASRKIIYDILKEQQLYALELPYLIRNVYRDNIGLYFDLIIATESKQVRLKIDHRFEEGTTRVILLE